MPNVVERSTELAAKVRDLELRVLALERAERPAATVIRSSWDEGVDIFPDGETVYGVFQRLINRAGMEEYTSHHRVGSMPPGFAWQTGSGFGGGANVDWNLRDTFMVWEIAGSPHFLYDSIGTYEDRRFYARLRVGTATEFGLRLDDGGTANYVELVLDTPQPFSTGVYNVDFRHKKAGGAESDTTGPEYPSTQFAVLSIRYVDDRIFGSLLAEDGLEVTPMNFDSGTVSWTPARVGFVARGTADQGWQASCDWFYNTFV